MTLKNLAGSVGFAALIAATSGMAHADSFEIQLSDTAVTEAHDGRVLLIITPDGEKEPRFQVKQSYDAPQIFGVNVNSLQGIRRPSTRTRVRSAPRPRKSTFAVPAASLARPAPSDGETCGSVLSISSTRTVPRAWI